MNRDLPGPQARTVSRIGCRLSGLVRPPIFWTTVTSRNCLGLLRDLQCPQNSRVRTLPHSIIPATGISAVPKYSVKRNGKCLSVAVSVCRHFASVFPRFLLTPMFQLQRHIPENILELNVTLNYLHQSSQRTTTLSMSAIHVHIAVVTGENKSSLQIWISWWSTGRWRWRWSTDGWQHSESSPDLSKRPDFVLDWICFANPIRSGDFCFASQSLSIVMARIGFALQSLF